MAGSPEVLHPAETGTRARRGLKLREARFEDYPQIVSLESRYRLDAKSREEWMHLWLGNPAYRPVRRDWPIGWVVEDENHQIVASIGNIPLLYEFAGKPLLAASGRAQVAEPACRSSTLLLLDRLIHQPGVDLYLNNTVTAEAAPSFSVFNCLPVPVGLWDTSAFWITQHQRFVQSYLTMKKYPVPKALSYPLGAGLYCKDLFAQKSLVERGVEVRDCPAFDGRFDNFWADLQQKNPHRLLAVRTRETLAWHFEYPLRSGQLWIATVGDGARLSAYAVFDRIHSPRSGLRRARLVDFQSLDGTTTLLASMLSWAVRKCQEAGIHMLEVVGRWLEEGQVIAASAPYRRNLGAWTYFYRANHPALAQSLSDARTWDPSLFDGNASL